MADHTVGSEQEDAPLGPVPAVLANPPRAAVSDGSPSWDVNPPRPVEDDTDDSEEAVVAKTLGEEGALDDTVVAAPVGEKPSVWSRLWGSKKKPETEAKTASHETVTHVGAAMTDPAVEQVLAEVEQENDEAVGMLAEPTGGQGDVRLSEAPQGEAAEKSEAEHEAGARVKITNGETPGSPQHSMLERLKHKWSAHVEKNKQNAQSRAAVKNGVEKLADAARPTDRPLTEEEQMQAFFLDFEPKRDRKKLTKALRKKIIEAEKLYQQGTISIKDLVAPTSMECKSFKTTLNGQYVQSFYVTAYPRFVEPNWLSSIINYDATMDISMFVYPTESAKIMRVLQRRVLEMVTTRNMQRRKGAIADPGLETALEDAERLRRDLQKGTERYFQLGMYCTVYADTEEKLKSIMEQLKTVLSGQMVLTRNADFRTERAFKSTLPQATDLLYEVRNMNTSPLSTTFPFVSSSLTSDEGILYGLNRHNNSLIIFDRFQLQNANSVVFAASGAGKSYAVKLEILRSLMTGTDVIVLDPENEYQNLTRAVGGTYINISLNSEQRINPFDLSLPYDAANAKPGDLLRENIINLIGLLNIMLGKLTPLEEGLMDRALFQTYNLKGITPETVDPTMYAMPTMLDLQNVLTSMQGGRDLALRLEKFTRGTFAGLFSKDTNVNLSSGLVTFSIRDLEDQLRPVAMYILLNFIWSKVRSDMKRRILTIDEAWNIVQHEDSGRFLHNLVKRARKYYLGVTTITQDVEDFMESPWGKPVITNAAMTLLLRQAPSAMDRLEKVFNLTQGERYLLLNAGLGQGLFFAGSQHVAVQVIASYGEDKLVTTNPQEVLEQRQAAA